MAYPDLYSDESVVLNAQNIKVKSVTFEAVLTTRRLILVDSKKHLIAPQEILLATLKDIEQGENAIRDPTITLSIITNTGATRQMILTFTKVSGGERRRECEEWVRLLRQNISSSVQHPIMPDVQTPQPEPAAAMRREAAAPPVQAPKKKIEIARPGPIKKIVEAPPSMPKPVETTSLPVGSFCNRCGNRVPPESAFCNKCGTPVVREEDTGFTPAPAEPAPAPSQVPQVHIPAQPVFGAAADRKERPIEEVIHSIEPLIEDSVPRTVPAPIVPKQHASPVVETPPAPPAAEAPATPEAPPAPVSPDAVPEVQWPVISPGTSPIAAGAPAAEPPAAEPPGTPPHFPVPPAVSRKPKLLIVGVVAIVIIAIIAAVFIFANPLGGGPGVATPTPTPTPTPEVTTIETTVPTPEETPVAEVTAPEVPVATGTPQTLVPASGVWVRVVYTGQYTGAVGLPGNQAEISGTGEHYFQVATSDGIVVAAIQKTDGSSDKLLVEVYKNGEMVAQSSTVTPKGIAEIQVNLKPPTTVPTPVLTPVPVTTVAEEAVNSTANATATTAAP